jgi:hypothetical protein
MADHKPLRRADKMPQSGPLLAALRGESPFWRRAEGRETMFKADGEPPLSELLADPILHLLMRCDGVSLEELRRLIDETRMRRQARACLAQVVNA